MLYDCSSVGLFCLLCMIRSSAECIVVKLKFVYHVRTWSTGDDVYMSGHLGCDVITSSRQWCSGNMEPFQGSAGGSIPP